MYLKKLSKYIESNQLFSKTDNILVALSGGADSVALLRMLITLGYTCQAAHCNFHLRDTESDRDEKFVTQLCNDLHIPLHIAHFDTKQEAKQEHISIEMAARSLRYAWFEELRQTCQASVIAVAHHQDDSVETFLLNLIRGTGIEGLRGIRPKNNHIVRPLLCLNRHEIITYLQSIKQQYVIDSTNLQDAYTRNKIRLNLLPLMQEINPSVKESILQTAYHLDDAAQLYHKQITEASARIRTSQGIDIPSLLSEAAPATLLFEALHPLGFNAAQVSDIFHSLSGQPGKQFYSDAWHVVKDRHQLLIEPKDSLDIEPQLEIQEFTLTTNFTIPRSRDIACVDADKITHPLTLRRWQQGDTFIPFGMKGKKKISDYLTDRKFSRLQKLHQWVLCNGNDIVWLVGERSDNRYRITNDTQKILCIKLKK